MNESVADAQEELLDRQRAAWARGERPAPEEFLPSLPPAERDSALLDLIYNEVVIREEFGEFPGLEEFLRRYPALATDLKVQFEVHIALRGDLADTLQFSGSKPDSQLPPALASKPDTAIGGYEILASLGEGGMGTVYKARDRSLNRIVALKMIHPGRVPSDRELRRFRIEAEAIARLQHPHIVRIHEVGEIDGAPYLSLEYAEGGTLAARLQEFPFTPTAAAELVQILSRAMHHAHQHGIVHRDLKPANILYAADGTIRIADFGLAKILEEGDSERDATRTGEALGTPRYMSPEQAAGRTSEVGIPADVHALGLLLYECLTGRVPFIGSNAVQTMQRIREEEPLPPRRLQAAIPRDLETICLHCLRKEPESRYASAQAVADDLGRFMKREPIHARPTPHWEKAWKWCRRNPTSAAGIACGLLLAIAGFGYAQVRGELEARRIEEKRDAILKIIDRGHEALAIRDARTARQRFLEAWTESNSEPALNYLATNVSGWLDHSRREEDAATSNRRLAPRSYEDIRDEAFLLALLAEKDNSSFRSDAFQHARSLMVEGDPAWNADRELAAAVEAECSKALGDPGAALATLDQLPPGRTKLWHAKRAACLRELKRLPEAEAERSAAEARPPQPVWELVDQGMVSFHGGNFPDAEKAFEEALTLEPGHFAARLFQAVCFLRANRPAEAKVGLTACIALRPSFAWSFLLRGDAHRLAGNAVAARADFERTNQLKPSPALQRPLAQRLEALALRPGEPATSTEGTHGDRE